MIAGTSGEYFVGDEFVLIGAEFIIDDIQEILPPHGSDQAVLSSRSEARDPAVDS